MTSPLIARDEYWESCSICVSTNNAPCNSPLYSGASPNCFGFTQGECDPTAECRYCDFGQSPLNTRLCRETNGENQCCVYDNENLEVNTCGVEMITTCEWDEGFCQCNPLTSAPTSVPCVLNYCLRTENCDDANSPS